MLTQARTLSYPDDLLLSESPDGKIIEIADEEDSLVARVKISFRHQIHFDYMAQGIKDGNVSVDLRSRLAQLHFDVEPLTSHNAFVTDAGKKEIDVIVRLAPWSNAYRPSDPNVTWKDLMKPDLRLLKLAHLEPSLKRDRESLEKRVRQGIVRLSQGSQIGDHSAALALRNRLYAPTQDEDLLSMHSLFSALHVVNRLALRKWQVVNDRVNEIVVPKNSGVIAELPLRSGGDILCIDINQGNGTLHSHANIISPTSTPSHMVELKGNGIEDVVATHVTGAFYEPKTVLRKSHFSFPDFDLHSQSVQIKYSPDYYIFRPGASAKRVIRIDEDDQRNMRGFTNLVASQKEGYDYFFYTFPTNDSIISTLHTGAVQGNVKSLVFAVPPVEGKMFSDADYHNLKKLSATGIPVLWQSEENGMLMFHDRAFMDPSQMPRIYDHAKETRSFLAMLGSHADVLPPDLELAEELIAAFAKYTGNSEYATVVSGGGPGFMTQALKIAKEKFGMRTGSVNMLKGGEPQVYHNGNGHLADFFMPMRPEDRPVRQSSLLGMPGPKGIFRGGVGTASEFYDILADSGILAMTDPLFLASEQDYWEPTLRQLSTFINDGRMDAGLRELVYPIENGPLFLPALLHHYRFQD